MARIGRAFPQNRFIPRASVFPAIAVAANTLHIVDHINTAVLQSTPAANTLHIVDHINTALLQSTPFAGVLHVVEHIRPAIAATGIAVTPTVVVLNPINSDIYNPTFNIVLAATPSLLAALIDVSEGAPIVPSLSGATVTFSLYNLGGTLVFTRAAVLDDAATGKVHYQVQAGDSAAEGTFLGKFHVTYSSTVVQDFPGDRYVNVFVDA